MVNFELTFRAYPGFAVVALAGELDAAGARAAVAAIQAGIGPGQRVIVDLGALRFAACHALGALAVAAKRARRAEGRVLLAAPQAAVLRVLELTGLARVLCVHASVAAAAAAAAGSAGCGSLPCAAWRPAARACPGRHAGQVTEGPGPLSPQARGQLESPGPSLLSSRAGTGRERP